jgi:hypothetical protein
LSEAGFNISGIEYLKLVGTLAGPWFILMPRADLYILMILSGELDIVSRYCQKKAGIILLIILDKAVFCCLGPNLKSYNGTRERLLPGLTHHKAHHATTCDDIGQSK